MVHLSAIRPSTWRVGGDERAIADSFAEDAVWRLDGELPISGTWNGRDEILGGFFATARTFLDPGSTRIEVTRSLADGDHVAVEWTSRARTRGGAPYENHCAGVFTVRDGKIRAVREYMDTHYAHKAGAQRDRRAGERARSGS
jgi:ketosteroid isomerase-like protein